MAIGRKSGEVFIFGFGRNTAKIYAALYLVLLSRLLRIMLYWLLQQTRVSNLSLLSLIASLKQVKVLFLISISCQKAFRGNIVPFHFFRVYNKEYYQRDSFSVHSEVMVNRQYRISIVICDFWL
jgi:hypothetical protein